MNKQNEITDKLKETIDNNGPDYLSDNPYQVFKILVNSMTADIKIAGAIFCVLVNNLHMHAMDLNDAESFSDEIKKTCGFNKKISDLSANVFIELYSDKNKENWKEKLNEGMKEFLEDEIKLEWEGFSVWKTYNGSVDCHYNAEIVFKPTLNILQCSKIKKSLDKNPFMKKEEFLKFFKKSLKDQLDTDFEEYCTCDDYYEPTAEDFEADYYASEWCSKNGFELISCDGDGYTDDYEPDYRRY